MTHFSKIFRFFTVMNRFLFWLLALACFCLPGKASATHIVGGEMTYTCLGNNEYEITLTVYRDCYNGVPWFDNPAYVAIYNADWAQVGPTLQLGLNFSANDTLPITLSNPCLIAPPDVCVHRTVYKTKVNLAFSPGGYTIVYQRCCRNQLIRNTPDPLNTGISIIAEIDDAALLACNTGSTFNSWPPVAICVNEPINFDHAASDADGDSLVYRLCTPLNGPDSLIPRPVPPFKGPYEEIVWTTPPYSLDNVLGGTPLTINPVTGFMTGIPNTIGNFVVGVCVDEYRNGTVISTTRRDFQYNVSDCGKPYSAFFVPEVTCDTLGVFFQNKSPNGTAFRWYFDWPANFNSSNLISPIHFFPDTGAYTIALIVQPDDPCADTSYQTIQLTNRFLDAGANYTLGPCGTQGLVIEAFDLSTDTVTGVSDWEWTLFQNGIPVQVEAVQNPVFTLPEAADYVLQLISTAGNGCLDTVFVPLDAPIPPVNALPQNLIICAGDSVHLFPGADPAFEYAWSPVSTLNDPQQPDPLAFPDSSTQYSVTIGGNGPCTADGTVNVQVVSSADTVAVVANPTLILPGMSSELTALFTGALGYVWSPANALSSTSGAVVQASPTTTTTYVVRAVLSGGCGAIGKVTVRVRDFSCEEPFVFFPNAFTPNGDGENDKLKLEGLFVEDVYWVVYNRWGEKLFEADDLNDTWDGNYKGQPQPTETYGYYLRVACVGGLISERKGNVSLLR